MTDKGAGGFFQGLKNMVERRRAVRVSNPRAVVDILTDGKTVQPLRVEDLSTRGIGVVLDFMPTAPAAVIRFKEPKILEGLEVDAEIRSVRKIEAGREIQYFAGYEFSFSRGDPEKKLYRWLSTCIEGSRSGSRSGATRKIVQEAARSGGRRPDPALVSKQEELNQCARLLNDRIPHFGLKETRFFIALEGSHVVSTLPFIHDTGTLRLPAEGKHTADLKPLRESGAVPAQVWAPAFSERWIASMNPRTAPLQKLDTLFSMFSLALVYALDFSEVTDLIAVSPPHLEEFFRMWLFERIPETEGGLMRLSLDGFEARACKERPELVSYVGKIRRRVELAANLRALFQPDPEFLRTWLTDCPER